MFVNNVFYVHVWYKAQNVDLYMIDRAIYQYWCGWMVLNISAHVRMLTWTYVTAIHDDLI